LHGRHDLTAAAAPAHHPAPFPPASSAVFAKASAAAAMHRSEHNVISVRKRAGDPAGRLTLSV
jgi:hypothetical protein